jgi:hypothetical protein
MQSNNLIIKIITQKLKGNMENIENIENTNEEVKRSGRPRLETKMLPEWKKIIIESGQQGKHITDFLIKLGISWDGHRALMKRNKEYYTAVQEYQILAENWWYENGRSAMDENGGMGYNSRMFSLIMRNKFSERWSDSTKVDVTTAGDKLTNSPSKIEIEIIKSKIEE